MAVGATGLLLLLLRQIDPLFWLTNDKRTQYLPVARDIGRRLAAGEFPLIDPNLGSGGNYSLDLQYGLYEPTHLLVDLGLARIDNLALAAFVWSALYLLVFAWGSTCLAQRLGAVGSWAPVVGVSAASLGYVLFFLAPNWMPGLISIAWLPWVWWCWLARTGARSLLGVAVFSYLIVAGGWPATWIMFVALMVGLLVEAMVRRERPAGAGGWLSELSLRAFAGIAGVIPAVLTVLPLQLAVASTIRATTVRNSNFLVPNVADILSFASPTIRGDLSTFGNLGVEYSPIYFAAWFALPLLWLVQWRGDVLRRTGVVSGTAATAVMLLMTQAPSTFGPFRDSIRALAGVQFFFLVTVVAVAFASSWRLTRMRAVGLVVSILAMTWLTWARAPLGVDGPVAVVLVGIVALAVMVVSPRWRPVAGVLTLVATMAFTTVAFALDPTPTYVTAATARLTPGRLSFSVADRPVFAIYPAASHEIEEQWFTDGVGRAFSRLSASTRIAPGYSSIRQRSFSKRFCILAAQGQTCPQVVRHLFRREGTTGRRWIDLLGYRTVVVSKGPALHAWSRLADSDWHRVDHGSQFVEYRRSGPAAVAGRITEVAGQATVHAVSVSNETQSYTVSSARGAALVFRDLYWPGYHATLNGQPLPVTALQDTLVTVRLPPGAHGTLTVTYAPLSTGELVGLPAIGLLLLAVVLVVAVRRRHAKADDSGAADDSGVDGDSEQGEPDHGQTLEHPV